MDNDEKMNSHEDETPPNFEDDSDADNPRPVPPSSSEDEFGSPFPLHKASKASGGAGIEPAFGLPEFGFPLSTRKGDEDRNLSSAQADEDGASAAKAILDSPPSDDTGWRHTESIERASAFESGEETGETVDEPAAFLPFRRQEANVMPFPSSAIQRPADQTPSEMLGGTAEFDEEAFPNGSGEDAQRSASDYGDDAHDALADAVQSALKNVYGGQSRDEAAPDLDSYTVADTLRLSAQERQQPEDESWREQSQDWPEENQDNYYETKSEPSEAETSTDAVLDYLYGHRRGERREATVLSADSSLRDFGEASGYGSRDWQDGSDYDDEAGAPGDLRDFGGPAFRNNPPPYAEPAEHSFPRERAYRGQPAEEPAWAEQRFPGVSAAAAPGSTYPIHLPSGNQESLAAGSPDSTHLLGAAGLGLIGGIALAGVLAVFVFNSFVDEGDPNAAAVAPKVVERLGGEPAETPSPTRPAPIQQAAIAREEPAPSPVQPAQPRFDAQPAFTQPARPSAPPAPAEDQKLIAYDVTGEASSPIQLALQLGETVDENGVLVSIKGLPSKARLSTGIDVGGGQWLLPPSRMSDLMVSIPDSAGGIHTLEAQLLKDDAQTVLSDPVSFKLGVGQEAAETLARQRQTASPNPNADQAERYAVLPDETPQIDTDLLTQMLIRDGNKLMRDGDIAGARRLYEQAAANGNPEAALAMGRSFDPSYFEKLPVKTGKPDPAVAFEWYKKALEGGLVTARVKIDGLKQWLQR